MTTVTEGASKGLDLLTVGGITAIAIVLLFIVGAIIESIYVRKQLKNRTHHLQKCVALKKDDVVRFDGWKFGLVVTNVQHIEHALIREKNKPTGILKVDYKRINEICKNNQ